MIGLFLVIALFGFGAGYETHNAATEVGCDLVVRDMVADYRDKGYAPIDGTQFSNGFAIIFADGAKANIEQNIFADAAPQPNRWLIEPFSIRARRRRTSTSRDMYAHRP